uniref:CSTF2_hinge domain-containing protein n=1 Tax=Mesocestoides corti TaxID=53468 RepID=A0A5K3FGB6_MESCO
MYELMKQMKLCIQNNPNEARNMLLQNPQLAYALLQAQIVMKIVDPKVAIAMLNRTHDQIPPLRPDTSVLTPSQSQIPPDVIASSNADVGAPPQQQFASAPINGGQFGNQPGNFAHDFPPSIPQEQMASAMAGAPGMYTGFQPPPPPPPPPQQQSAPFQHLQQQQQHLHRPHQPGGTPPQPVPPGLQPATGLPQAPFPMGGLQGGVPPPPPIPPTGIPSLDQMNPAISAAMMGGGGGGSSGGMAVPGLPQKEQEKLDLIMQVLSLSEESIAMLPEDQ